jgi:hypothetical protein
LDLELWTRKEVIQYLDGKEMKSTLPLFSLQTGLNFLEIWRFEVENYYGIKSGELCLYFLRVWKRVALVWLT